MSEAISKDALIEQVTSAREELWRQADDLTSSALGERPAEDEWSIVEVLAHLIDVDEHWLGQALAIRDNSEHIFEYFDDERWKREHQNIREQPIVDIERRLKDSHAKVIQGLWQMTEHELERPGKHPRGIPYTVRDIIRRYPAHDRNHAEQIKAIKEHLLRRAGGRDESGS